MKNLFYPLLFATAFVATACTSTKETDFDTPVDPNGKTAISFVGESNNHPVTRAGFKINTHIAMHIRSNKSGANDVCETRTVANALKDDTQSDETISSIEAPSDENVRYWDDAYGRDANLSVFAIAVPGKDNTLKNNSKSLTDLLDGNSTWNDSELTETIAWTVSADQSGDNTIDNEDLVYSNNIQGDNKMKFNTTSGKFDQGNLQFNHALCRITVNLKKGEGFTGENTFQFTDGSNVKVLGVPTTGTFDVENGTWETTDKTGVTKMAETKKDDDFKPDHAFLAQIIPIYTINNTSKEPVLSFVIDNNQYYVTQTQMFEALKDNKNISSDKKTATDILFENGRNYVFNITVGKTKITNVTSTVVDWIDVKGTYDINNSHYSFSLFNQGTAVTTDNSFKFYRYQDATITDIKTDESKSKAWFGNYTASTNLTYNTTDSRWETEWFFEDNTKFYHFRTTSYENVTDANYHKDATNGDYFTMTSGALSSEVGKGTDYLWGAPFVSSTTSPIQYNPSDGYTALLSPAVGATKAALNMTELHMMSNIKIVLKTTDQPAATNNAVVLYDGSTTPKGSTIAITNFYTQGDVNMGSGKVSPKTLNETAAGVQISSPATTSSTTFYKTEYTETNEFSYSVVPQSLVEGTRKVGLIITTPDNNQYVITDISKIAVSSNTGSLNQGSTINYWYPGHRYIYTITLTKTGIANITCSVVDWITITANQNISLEN